MSANGISRRQFLFVAASALAGGVLLTKPHLSRAVGRPRENTSIRRAYGGSAYGSGGYGTASATWPGGAEE